MKIEINIRKRYTYAILLVLILGFSIFIAISQPAPTQGHPASEIRPGSFQEGDYIFPDTSQVGIGTNNPTQKLDVRGKILANNPPALGYGSVVSKGAITAVHGDNTHYGYFEGRRSDNKRGFYLGWGNGNDLVTLWLDSANKLNIGGGNVGIGTTNPSQKLHIRNNDTNLVFNIDQSVSDKVAIEAFNDGNTIKRDILLSPWGGKVGIGTTNPGSFKLYVNGKARANTPLATDPDDTVATKGYVDAQVGGGGLVLVAENTNDETFTQSDANAIQNFINNKGVITDAICCYTSGCSKIHPSYIHTGPSTIFLYAGSPGLVATYKIFCNSNVPSKRCAVGSVSTANCTCGWKILGQRYQ